MSLPSLRTESSITLDLHLANMKRKQNKRVSTGDKPNNERIHNQMVKKCEHTHIDSHTGKLTVPRHSKDKSTSKESKLDDKRPLVN